MNVFGVEHDTISKAAGCAKHAGKANADCAACAKTMSKADALGSTESVLHLAHAAGQHAGKTFRRCPKCMEGSTHAASTTRAAETRGGAMRPAHKDAS